MIEYENTRTQEVAIGGLPLEPALFPDLTPHAPEHASRLSVVSAPKVSPTHWRTRLFSLGMLCLVAFGLYRGGVAAYYAFRDSFVAPIVFAPDNDMVIQARLSLLRLEAERRAIVLRIDESRGAIEAAEGAIKALADLKLVVPKSIVWSHEVASSASNLASTDLRSLDSQREVLHRAIRAQEASVDEMRRNLESGLVRKADLTREEMELARLRVAALQKDRELSSNEAQRFQSSLARSALHGRSSRVLPPEVLAAREQLVRIGLDVLKLQVEKRAKEAQLLAAQQELEKVDDMLAQMKSRPIFRAISSELNVAFVPYSQMEGVVSGAVVYGCSLWGVFFCRRVGAVVEMLPGEVALQDPSGTPSRGQYAVLRLEDRSAARERMLRIRQGTRVSSTPGGTPSDPPIGLAGPVGAS
jgi:hypothetical protein